MDGIQLDQLLDLIKGTRFQLDHFHEDACITPEDNVHLWGMWEGVLSDIEMISTFLEENLPEPKEIKE